MLQLVVLQGLLSPIASVLFEELGTKTPESLGTKTPGTEKERDINHSFPITHNRTLAQKLWFQNGAYTCSYQVHGWVGKGIND